MDVPYYRPVKTAQDQHKQIEKESSLMMLMIELP